MLDDNNQLDYYRSGRENGAIQIDFRQYKDRIERQRAVPTPATARPPLQSGDSFNYGSGGDSQMQLKLGSHDFFSGTAQASNN